MIFEKQNYKIIFEHIVKYNADIQTLTLQKLIFRIIINYSY
jgi:hypothetical protein